VATVVALIHGEPGAYGIGFPDFPGAVSGGDTLDEALRRGRETLAVHVAAMIEEGLPLPRLRDLDALALDPIYAEDRADAVLVTAVSVELPSKAVRVNVSLDEGLLSRIDDHVRSHGGSRSGFLAEAARSRLLGN